MNYTKHYELLIERARDRELIGYSERHHVIPKCMGGPDDPTNVVRLTAEEHYLAHQLLVKMYPHDRKLIFAATMMSGNSENHQRANNKIYGWLRRKLSEAQTGRIFSEETKEKMRNRVFSEEHRRRIGLASTGKQWSLGLKRSDETRLKMSLSKKGKPNLLLRGRTLSEETKEKLRKPKTEEHKQKLREANLTPEARERISKLHKGKIVSDEQKRKQSEAMKGKLLGIKKGPMSEEHRQKIAQAHKSKFGSKDLPLGIGFDRKANKYRARYRGVDLGRYVTLEEAVQVYNNRKRQDDQAN